MAPNSFLVSDPAYGPVLSKLRQGVERPATVRALVGELTKILTKNAVKEAASPDEKIAVIVILRSGLAMMEPFVDCLPEDTDMVIHHIGLFRERQTLQPVEYYNKLPLKAPNIKRAYVLDPLVATGGTAGAAISILRSVCLACSPEYTSDPTLMKREKPKLLGTLERTNDGQET